MLYSVDTIELRKAMVEKEIYTIVELSQKSDVNRNTLSGILNGDIRPSSAIIERIAGVLSLGAEDIGRIFFKNKLS